MLVERPSTTVPVSRHVWSARSSKMCIALSAGLSMRLHQAPAWYQSLLCGLSAVGPDVTVDVYAKSW